MKLQNISLVLTAFKRKGFSGVINIYKRKANLKNRKEKVSFIPFSVSIEPTTLCNLKCKMCSKQYSKAKETTLSFEEFKKIVDNNPYIVKINLTGIGEPFLNPEIFEIIKYAKSKGIFVWLFSNMTLLNENNILKAKEAGLDEIWASIDGADKETYQTIRKGADFDLVIENTKKAVNAGLNVFIGCLAMPQNYKKLPAIIGLAKTLGIKKVGFSATRNFGKNDEYDFDKIETGEIKKINGIIAEKAKRSGILVSSYATPAKENKNYSNCKIPWKGLHISSNGKVQPCCATIFFERNTALGNALTTPLKDIWNNKAYCGLRRQLLLNEEPGLCKGCIRIN